MSEWQEVRPRVKARARQLNDDEIFVGTSGRVDAPAGSWILEQNIGDTRYSYVLLDDDFHRQWLMDGEDFDSLEESDENRSPDQIPLTADALATVGTPVETDTANANVRPADFDFGAQETDRTQVPADQETAPTEDDESISNDTTAQPGGATESDDNAASEMPPVGNTLEEKGTRRSR